MCVCAHTGVRACVWLGLKQVTVGTRVWSTARLVGGALSVLTGAGN